MNIRKKDISVNRNHNGFWVLSTIHNGYFRKHISDSSLKWARVEFIDLLKAERREAPIQQNLEEART